MRVLVTGGTGVLGRELVPRLRNQGAEVRVLSRRPSDRPLHVPAPGRIAAGFRAGHHPLSGGGERGTRTFEDYLRSRIAPDGTVTPPPYELKLRR